MEEQYIVTVSERKPGILVIHEFKRATKTDFGNKIAEKLNADGLPYVKEFPGIENLPKGELPAGDHIWQCLVCGDMSGFDLEGVEYTGPIFKRISKEMSDHRKNSPGCAGRPSIRILVNKDGCVSVDEPATQLFRLRM